MKQKITLEIENDTGVEFEEVAECSKLRMGEYYVDINGKVQRSDYTMEGCKCIVLTPKVDHELEAPMVNNSPELVIPNGWEKLGYKIPADEEGFFDAFGNFVIYDASFGTCKNLFLCFRKIDTELEEAKKKFPTDSLFSGASIKKGTLETVKNVRRSTSETPFITIDAQSGYSYAADRCTPFPIAVWRCCYSSPPKKWGTYFTRTRNKSVWCFSYYEGQWPDPNCEEWLDEGGE